MDPLKLGWRRYKFSGRFEDNQANNFIDIGQVGHWIAIIRNSSRP